MIDTMNSQGDASVRKREAMIFSDSRACLIQVDDFKVFKAKSEGYQILNKKDSFPSCSYSKEDIS